MGKKEQILLVLDILDGTLLSERSAIEGRYLRPNLRLSFANNLSSSSSERLSGKTAIRAIKRMRRARGWENTHLVVGAETDPMYPFNGRFDVMVKCLEEIAACPPAHLTIQTRSPLLVLALPLLKALGDKLTVVFAFEALNDQINQRFTPSLPRPSERMTAARTLNRFGIDVHLQVSPIVGGRTQAFSRKILSTFVSAADSATRTIEILPVQYVVSEELSPLLRDSTKNGEFQKISHLALKDVCRLELTRAKLALGIDHLSEIAA